MSGGSETIIVALIVSLVAPSILAYLNGRQRQAEKVLDWARQDAVARRLMTQNIEAESSRQAILQATKETSVKLDVVSETVNTVHVLVNSNMTASMQSELESTQRELVALQEIVRIHMAADRQPEMSTLEAIDKAKIRIEELRLEVANRLASAPTTDQRGSNDH